MINFIQKQPFADLEIVCADGTLWYSKFSLCALSSAFAGFQGFAEDSSNKISFPNISSCGLNIILSFGYGCQRSIPPFNITNIVEIIEFCDQWNIQAVITEILLQLRIGKYGLKDVADVFCVLPKSFIDHAEYKPLLESVKNRCRDATDTELIDVTYKIFRAPGFSADSDTFAKWCYANKNTFHLASTWQRLNKSYIVKKFDDICKIILTSENEQFKKDMSLILISEKFKSDSS